MRHLWLVLAVACSSGTPPAQPPPTAKPVPPPPAPPPAAVARGGACAVEGEGPGCGEGMLCMPAPGGYCTSFCGVTGTACNDGTCMPTARAGEFCAATCSRDSDCREKEGYRCDPDWKACSLPGMAAMKVRTCPAVGGRDPAFAASEALTREGSPGIYQFEPTAVIGDDGSVIALYTGRGRMTEGNTLGLSRGGSDGAFASERNTHFDPWLARDRKGTLYAVWLGFDGRAKNQQIGFATSTDKGATWSKPVAAHDPGDCKDDAQDCLDKPMVAVGPDPGHKGEVVYVMYSSEEKGLRVRASHDGGKTFSQAVSALEGIYGTVAVAGDGRVHVATLNGGPRAAFGSPEHKVEYAMSKDGGATFGKSSQVSAPGEAVPFFFSNPSVAVDDKRGWIYVAYSRGGPDAKWDIAIAASRDGATWTRTQIADDCATHLVPNLAVDPTTGTLHVAWYDGHGGGRFAHATCPPGAKACKEAGAINDQPFGSLTTVRHGAGWIGEYESLVVDDKHRTLHAVWTQPVGSPAVSRIFHAKASLR